MKKHKSYLLAARGVEVRRAPIRPIIVLRIIIAQISVDSRVATPTASSVVKVNAHQIVSARDDLYVALANSVVAEIDVVGADVVVERGLAVAVRGGRVATKLSVRKRYQREQQQSEFNLHY